MAIEVGEIVAVLRADASQFTDGLNKANKSLDKMKADFVGVQEPLNTTGLSLVSLGGKLTAASAALGALGFAAAKEFGSYAENVELIAQKTGFSIKSVQEFNFALNRVGLTVDDLLPGFKKFSATIDAAFGGDVKAAGKITALGLSIETLKNQTPEQIFLALADAIGKIEDPFRRSAAASDIFGRAGSKLIPVFIEGSQGFEKAAQRAQELGTVFSGATLSSMSQLDDGLDDMNEALAALSRTFASTTAGPLKEFIIGLTDTLGAINKWWQGLDAGTKKVVLVMTAAFAASGPIIATIGAFMVAISAGLGPLMLGGAIVVGLIGAVTTLIVNWESIKTKGIAIWTGLRDGVVKAVTDTYEGIKKYLTDKLMAIIEPVQKFSDSVLGIFKRLRYELVGGSEVPEMVAEIGDHMRMLDKNMTAPARVAAQGTWAAFRDLAGQMDSTARQISTTMVSVWSSASSSISNAIATDIVKGNDWKQTMESLTISVLSAFINLGIQLIAQKAMELAMRSTINAAIIAGESATAGGIVAIWTAASAAIIGAFGAMTGAIATFFTATIIPLFAAVGEVIMMFLAAIATSLDISIFGAAFSIPIWAAVALVAAAVGAISAFAFGAFAEGGLITKPTMALMGEAGPEAVIPLDKLGQLGNGPMTVVVELDGRTIARTVFDNMPSIMRVRGVSA